MISIIVPVYNTPSALIRRGLDSLYLQDVDIEILLIDDGSQRETADYLDSVRGDGVKVLHKQNGGVSSARNMGLDNAVGEYIAFMDPDDELKPGYLASALNYLIETGVTAVFGGMEYVYPDGKSKADVQEFESGEHCRILESDEIVYLQRSLFEKAALAEIGVTPIQYVSNCGVLYKRDAIKSLRFRENIVISEDRIFNYEFLESNDSVALADDCWYVYHQNPNSASHRVRLNAANELRATAEAYIDLVNTYRPSDSLSRSIDMGILECLLQAVDYCIFDSDFSIHFGCKRNEYVSSLLASPEFSQMLKRVKPVGLRWKILAYLGRMNTSRGIVIYTYMIRALKIIKKAFAYKKK